MRRIITVGEHAANLAPAYMWISRDFERIETSQFETKGAYGGHPWAPISDSWAKQKAAAGGDPRVLHFTLALRNSLTRRNARGAVRTVRPDSLTMGTRIPYSHFHVTGTRYMDARQPIVIPGHDRRRWNKALTYYIMHGRMP